MTERYFIDERVGCIAVRDREKTDLEYQGLRLGAQGVVGWWGTYSDGVPPWAKAQAILLCAELNAKDRHNEDCDCERCDERNGVSQFVECEQDETVMIAEEGDE